MSRGVGKRKKQALCLLIVAPLVLGMALLEAPELATLTNDTSNDPARIEISQDEILRIASIGQTQAEMPIPISAARLLASDFESLSYVLSLGNTVRPLGAGQALLHLLVTQRK